MQSSRADEVSIFCFSALFFHSFPLGGLITPKIKGQIFFLVRKSVAQLRLLSHEAASDGLVTGLGDVVTDTETLINGRLFCVLHQANTSTGFSHFMLECGWPIQGPLDLEEPGA